MKNRQIGVLGATSLVGKYLLPALLNTGFDVVAFSRQTHEQAPEAPTERLLWKKLPNPKDDHAIVKQAAKITHWICLAPVWVLPDHFDMFLAFGADRVVVLSSTSRFTKTRSSAASEQTLSRRLAAAESRFTAWAEAHHIKWTILYPTLIYGDGRDRNISEIACFIQRFGFFPLLGSATGLRQPLFAGDVAEACRLSLLSPRAIENAYNISGGETLTYRAMVERIFLALGIRARFIHFPLGIFKFALIPLRLLPRFRHWNAAMAERMNQNLVFDHAAATDDFGFSPRPFALDRDDLPERCRQKESGLNH